MSGGSETGTAENWITGYIKKKCKFRATTVANGDTTTAIHEHLMLLNANTERNLPTAHATVAVARRVRRNFIGIEIVPRYSTTGKTEPEQKEENETT